MEYNLSILTLKLKTMKHLNKKKASNKPGTLPTAQLQKITTPKLEILKHHTTGR